MTELQFGALALAAIALLAFSLFKVNVAVTFDDEKQEPKGD